MRKELDDALCAKYPILFKNRNGDIRETCMAWGFDVGDGWYNLIDGLCHIITHHEENLERDVESNRQYLKEREAALKGDWSLFDAHHKDVDVSKYGDWLQKAKEHLVGEMPEWRKKTSDVQRTVAAQVKEKFGGLRFYYDGGDDFVAGAVALAERISYSTCEVCGHAGKPNDSGWIRTRCDKCEEVSTYGQNYR